MTRTEPANGDRLDRYVAAVPLAAALALGLGPFSDGRRPRSVSALHSIAGTPEAILAAINFAGIVGRQLLDVIGWHRGGSVDLDRILAETTLGEDDVAEELERLEAAGLVEGGRNGWVLTPLTASMLPVLGVSVADADAITSDALGLMCSRLGLGRTTRKQERIDAIAGLFADAEGRERVRAELSGPALALLGRVADWAGPRVVSVELVGIDSYALRWAEPRRFAGQRPPSDPEVAALAELTGCGILGLDSYSRTTWIWREAWPLADRPIHSQWELVKPPPTVDASQDEGSPGNVLTDFARALSVWDSAPPPVLKNGEIRLAKSVVKATAKDLGRSPEEVELLAALALGIGFYVPAIVSDSGRGRNRRVERAWVSEPDLRRAWSALSAPQRWARLVAEWSRLSAVAGPEEVASRHITVWELSRLDPGRGWDRDEDVVRWLANRYGPISQARWFERALGDLRALGVVSRGGPVRLTGMGSRVLGDPASLDVEVGADGALVVQADHTVMCPAGTDPEIVARLSELAALESDGGVRVFRLDEARITAAVQRGQTAESVLEFLSSLSSVPIDAAIERLISDAAARAGRIRIFSGVTVVVATEPAHLVTACKVASAKLTPVTDTVAVSELDADRLRKALDRRGLAPLVFRPEPAAVAGSTRSDSAAALRRSAERFRALAEVSGNQRLVAEADRLEAQAEEVADPSLGLRLDRPFFVTRGLVAEVPR